MTSLRALVGLSGLLLLAACSRAAAPPAEEAGPAPPPASPPAQFDPWQNARERGIDFRGVGQEPGWFVEVDHEKGLRLVWDYADQQAVASTPLKPELVEGTTMYRATTGAHQIEVAIEATPCNDAMSGQTFPNTVTVNVDGRALRGCGRTLE
jgi:putative lipoprotein